MTSSLTQLAQTARDAGLPWDDGWLLPIGQLASLLLLGQARTNLVGDASPAGLADHILQALCVAELTQRAIGDPRCVVDVGAGAGLASVAYALIWPHAQVIAVEPRRLRAEFVDEVAKALGLANLSVQKRSLHSAQLQPAGLVVARAVWPAEQWLPKAFPLLTLEGVAAVHGHGPAQDLSAALAAFGEVVATREVPGPRGHAIALLRRT